jgi:hypothetical protein
VDLETELPLCPVACIPVDSFFSANDSSTPPNSLASIRLLVHPCAPHACASNAACTHHAGRVSTRGKRRRSRTQPTHPMSQSAIWQRSCSTCVHTSTSHQTKVLRRKELFVAISVSNSFIAVAKVSDGLYTSPEPVSNCRDAPTRTRLSSCIYVANLMQLRRCERRYVACDPPTQPFQGKTFPNQQPRRGRV